MPLLCEQCGGKGAGEDLLRRAVRRHVPEQPLLAVIGQQRSRAGEVSLLADVHRLGPVVLALESAALAWVALLVVAATVERLTGMPVYYRAPYVVPDRV